MEEGGGLVSAILSANFAVNLVCQFTTHSGHFPATATSKQGTFAFEKGLSKCEWGCSFTVRHFSENQSKESCSDEGFKFQQMMAYNFPTHFHISSV